MDTNQKPIRVLLDLAVLTRGKFNSTASASELAANPQSRSRSHCLSLLNSETSSKFVFEAA